MLPPLCRQVLAAARVKERNALAPRVAQAIAQSLALIQARHFAESQARTDPTALRGARAHPPVNPALVPDEPLIRGGGPVPRWNRRHLPPAPTPAPRFTERPRRRRAPAPVPDSVPLAQQVRALNIARKRMARDIGALAPAPIAMPKARQLARG